MRPKYYPGSKSFFNLHSGAINTDSTSYQWIELQEFGLLASLTTKPLATSVDGMGVMGLLHGPQFLIVEPAVPMLIEVLVPIELKSVTTYCSSRQALDIAKQVGHLCYCNTDHID